MANVRQVRLGDLHESPTNPRKLFGDLSEMAESIKAQGILMPLLAREVDGHLELVFGHRRLRASKLAGLKEVPVIVREMDDVEVLEAQITENLAREDVHPLELAESYERLMGHGLNADAVADRLGISRSSVFTTLKLLDLVPAVRASFLKGQVSTHAAVAIARLKGERLQESALKAVVDASKDGPLPVRTVQRLLASRFSPKKEKLTATKSSDVEDRELAQRTTQVLIRRAVELSERKSGFDDADVRLLLLALSEMHAAVKQLLDERGATERKLAGLRGPHLRGLLLEAVLSLWLRPGEPQEKVVARAYALELPEMRKTAKALIEADRLMGRRE